MALKSRSQVTDFVARFTRDPFEAALDLLQESPTGAVVAGIGVALRRTSRLGSQSQLRRLFRRAVELIVLKADGRAPELSYEPLVQIALQGNAAPEDGLLRDAITTLLEVRQARWALRLAVRYEACHHDLNAGLSKRLVTDLILHRIPYGSCTTVNRLRLNQDEWRSLQWLALVNEEYDWVIGLARYIDDPVCVPDSLLRHFAHRVVRVGNGRDAGRVLQRIAGRTTAANILGSMLSALEIPPREVGKLARWLCDPSIVRACVTEYFRLAVRQRCGPECYSEIAQWADPGDLDSDLAEPLMSFLVEEEEWEAALLVIHAADLKVQHAQVIVEAEEVLDPSSPRVMSRHWGDLVFRKFWHDWSEGFRSRVLSYSVMHPEDMVLREWSAEALGGLRSLLRNQLERLECVVNRAACELAGIEDEAGEIVKKGIVEVFHRGDQDLALDMAIAWSLTPRELDFNTADHTAVQQAVRSRILCLFEAGEIRDAFLVCEAWGVEPQEVLPSVGGVSSGETPAEVIVTGSDEGVFAISEVEAWFLARLRKGDVGQALSVRQSSSLRQELYGSAVLAALELFEDGRYREAGQVIAAFELQDGFRTELSNIIPHLVAEGKTGIAEQLVQSLGPQYSRAFADLILEAARSRLEQGEMSTLSGLIDTTGMSFLRDEFKPVLRRYVADALHAGKLIEIRGIMEYPVLASLIGPSHLLVQALEQSGARVVGTVTRVVDGSYAFAVLQIARLKVFVHSSVLRGAKMGQLKAGSRLVLAIKASPKGPAATWGVIASGGSDVVTQQDALRSGEDGGSLAKLRDAWGARLRDAR